MKLGSLFSGMAQRRADNVSIICKDRRITFRELERTTNRIANALLARGLKPLDRMALWVPNSAEIVEAMGGVVKMGGIIVPISTRLTLAEVQFILGDVEPRVVFFSPETRKGAREAAAKMDNPVLIVTEGAAEPGEIALSTLAAEGSEAQPPFLPAEPDDCLIAYTSGTTGHPKGAISTHASLVFSAGFLNATEFQVTSDDAILVTTPIAHRIGLSRITNMLTTGCRLVIMTRFDPAEAVDLIEKEKVTILGCVPTVVRLMMPEIEKRPQALKSLRLISATGEVFPVELKKRLFEAVPDVGIYSYYAGTEPASVCALLPHEQRGNPGSMGRAIPGVEVRLVDQELNDVPLGTTGEILVRCGRPGLFTMMKGYYKRPEANKEVFVQDGWLRTGDLAYKDAEGYYYFADRAKDMVVSGGFNIYSKEVELALLSHAAVADAAVVGIPDEEYGEAVVAFIESKPGMTATPEEIIEHCRDKIASYKKPRHVLFIPTLPRTGTGKVQKGELRKIAAAETA